MEKRKKKYGKQTMRENVRIRESYGTEPEYHRLLLWNDERRFRLPYYLFAWEEFKRGSRYSYEESSCRFAVLSLLLEGENRYRVNGRDYRLSAPCIMVIPPYSSYRFSTRGEFYHKLTVELKGGALLSFLEYSGLGRARAIRCADRVDRLTARFRRIEELLEDDGSFSDIAGAVSALTAEVISLLPADEAGDCAGAIEKARALLERYPDRMRRITELARECGMHPVALARKFRRQYGVTPSEYRCLCRMNEAEKLLGNTSAQMKEIAFRPGYCNPYYFSSEFRRCFGMSPAEWRKRKGAGKTEERN